MPTSKTKQAAPRPQAELKRIDVDALCKLCGDKREVMRSLRLAEKQGQAVSKTMPDGSVAWFAVPS